MRLESFPRTLLFIIFLVWTTGVGSALTVGLSGSWNAQRSAVEGYGAKTQVGGEAAVDVLFPATAWLNLGVSAGCLGAMASDMFGGFGYRAYSGGFLGLVVEASAPLASTRSTETARAGVRLGGLANVAVYSNAALAFFFPSLALDGFLRLTPKACPHLEIGVTLPLRVYFRKDFLFSGSAGLGVSVAVSRGRAP
jgi:hypothetical protein